MGSNDDTRIDLRSFCLKNTFSDFVKAICTCNTFSDSPYTWLVILDINTTQTLYTFKISFTSWFINLFAHSLRLQSSFAQEFVHIVYYETLKTDLAFLEDIGILQHQTTSSDMPTGMTVHHSKDGQAMLEPRKDEYHGRDSWVK